MTTRPFNEYTDDFSALVIYTALLALQAKPELWSKYTQHDLHGKLMNMNLLFSQADFIDPARSQLIHDLNKINEPRLVVALQKLIQACQVPVEQVRFPKELIDPDRDKKKALVKLEQAIQDNDDERIVNAWGPTLQAYKPAQQHAKRVALAEQTLQTLKRFRAAIKTQQVQQIVAAYDASVLDSCKQIKYDEKACLILAQNFLRAYQDDDDQAIVTASDEIQSSSYGKFLTFTAPEQQRITLAQQRKIALIKFRIAVMNKRPEPIVVAYDASILDTNKSLTHDERELMKLSRNFVQAYRRDDDQAIIAATDDIHSSIYRTRLTFASHEQQRIEFARQRGIALVKLQVALANKQIQPLAAAYDTVLDTSTSVTQEEHELVRLAKNFVLAYHKDDDQSLTAVYNEIKHSATYQQHFIFTQQEQQRIALAEKRQTVWEMFRHALASKSIQQIVTVYDPILDNSKGITQAERDQLTLASDFAVAYRHDDDEAIIKAWDEIQNFAFRSSFIFTTQEQQRIALAQQRKSALVRFRMALLGRRPGKIIAAYDPILDDCKNVTAVERQQIDLAGHFVQAYQSSNDQNLLSAWNNIQNSPYRAFFLLNAQEQQHITQIQMDGKKKGGH
jgi:hypothetical protein